MAILSGRNRLPRACHVLVTLLLVVLLAGQRQVFGDEHQQQAVVGASGEIETMGSKEGEAGVDLLGQEDIEPEKTPEGASLAAEAGGLGGDGDAGKACVDMSLLEEERRTLQEKLVAAEERVLSLEKEKEAQRIEHDSELGSCGSNSKLLRDEVEVLKGEVGQLGGVLERAGGEEGIRELVEAAQSAEIANKEKETASEAAATATKEKEEAVKNADDMKLRFQGELDAARTELAELRGVLSEAEARESQAREEAGKHANAKEEVRRRLERTESELEIAKKPRKVSVSAIAADVKELANDLGRQSADARDDLVARASVQVEKAKEVVLPWLHTARDTASPWVEQAMVATAPQRAQAGEAYVIYRGKFEESVEKPVTEKWLVAKAEVLSATSWAMAKWEEVEVALEKNLVSIGMSEESAEKICKYMYMALMALAAVLFVVYFARTVITVLVLPLVRTALRLVLWVVKIPFRILFLPVRLVFWLLASCFRLAFGGGKGKGNAAPEGSKAKTGTKNSRGKQR